MTVLRPLTKPILKKMFLKCLYEFIGPNARYSSHALGADSVIGMLPHHFKIDHLSGAEKTLAIRGVYELERDGFGVMAGEHSGCDRHRQLVGSPVDLLREHVTVTN